MVYVICFKLFWFDVLSVIGIPFWLYNFRTHDRKYWGESVHVAHGKVPEMYIYKRGVFSDPRPWLLNLHFFSLLCNVATLALNIATLQCRDVAMSRRQFYPPLERRDMRFQRRNVDFEHLWNVATLISNVAMLILNDSGTSRH